MTDLDLERIVVRVCCEYIVKLEKQVEEQDLMIDARIETHDSVEQALGLAQQKIKDLLSFLDRVSVGSEVVNIKDLVGLLNRSGITNEKE